MRFVAWMLVLAACDPLPPTGDPLSPVRPASTTSPAAPAPASASSAEVDPGGFDFEGDEGVDVPIEDIPDDPAALLALSQGKEPPPAGQVPPAPTPVSTTEPAPVVAQVGAPAAMPAWDPSAWSTPEWGVHLVSTVADVQPPMAVVGLPDGSTVVVRPGSFLPEQRVVVMAIGRDAVQIARIVPEGYQARVESRTLTSLFPAGAPRASPP